MSLFIPEYRQCIPRIHLWFELAADSALFLTRANPSGVVSVASDRTGGRAAPERAFGGAGRLARALFAGAPGRSLLAAGLLLASAVTETFGIALLIPLLYAAGLEGGSNEGASAIRETVARGAEAVGVEPTLPILLGAFVLLAGVRSAVAWQRDVQLAALRLGFVDGLRERLFAATAEARWLFLVRRRSSDLLHVLTHDVGRAGQGAMHLVQGSVGITFALAQAVLAVAVSPPLAAGILLVAGALLLAAGPLVGRSRRLGDRLTAGGRAAHGAMTEFLGGLKLAKSEATEARHVRDFTRAFDGMRRRQLDFTRTRVATRALFNVGAVAALAALVGVGIVSAGLNLPELAVMALIAGRLLPLLLRVQQDAQQLAHVLPGWLHALETEEALRGAAEAPARSGAPPLPLERELTVRGVTFGYPASPDPPALAELDLAIPARRLVAVTGPSGAGKTTLADLLLGLIEPDSGAVLVDGVPLLGAARRRWRNSVAYVPQDPHLFHETLRTNLLRARPGATEAELWQALRQAAADGFVAALPEGLDTVVGDRGGRLSGGQRQRIVLARALLRDPALLLLDEATSHLDAETERRVLETLRSLRSRTTVVAVTHRPAMLAAADAVVRLEAGRVTASGISRAAATPSAAAERAAAGPAAAAGRWLPGLLAACLLAAAPAAQAQPGSQEDFRSQATMRAGPLYLKPSFRLERLGFESNVFYEPDPKPDFVIAAAPRVDAWLPLYRQAHILATVIGSTDWYAEHAGERAFNPEIASRIVLPWRRLALRAGGSYLRTRRRPDFEIDVRSDRFAEEVHGGAAIRVASRLWLDLEARRREVGFEGNAFLEGTYLSETLNRKERSGIASLRWQATALTTLVLTSEARKVRFLRSPERDSDNIVVTAGADFHPRALISGSGRIGVRRFLARGAAVSDVSSIVAEADLSFRIAGSTAVTFSAERDINYSFERASPYYVLDSYGLLLTRRLGRLFDLNGRVNQDRYGYVTAARGVDVRWRATGGLGYRLHPKVSAGIEAGYLRSRSTTSARRRYRGIIIGFVLNYDI